MIRNTLAIAVLTTFVAVLASLIAAPAMARNETIDFPMKTATGYVTTIADDIRFFLKGQKHPGVAKQMGVFKSNRRTNAFNKSDEHACSIAFASAIISLQKRAPSLGGDAVVDIVSVTKHDNLESATDFRCNVGSFVANVALTGRVVKLK